MMTPTYVLTPTEVRALMETLSKADAEGAAVYIAWEHNQKTGRTPLFVKESREGVWQETCGYPTGTFERVD